MKDLTGKELAIGDKIVFMHRNSRNGVDLTMGEIVGFSPKMVRVSYADKHAPLRFKISNYAPHNTAIIEKAL